MSIKELLAKVDLHDDDIRTCCQELVRTPSLPGNEKKIGQLILSYFRGLEYDDFWIDTAGNVVGKISGINKGSFKTIAFNGHMDHVDAGNLNNWKYSPYEGVIKNGKLWGRGAADMKGPLGSMIMALGLLKRFNVKPSGDLFMICVVQEEIHEGFGMQYVLETDKRLDPEIVVLGEPTNLDLAIGQRGRAEIEVITGGKTSHAAMPELGMNAVLAMRPVLDQIEEIQRSLPEHEKTGKESIALTHISCEPGVGPIVPDLCKVIIDRRISPEVSADDITAEAKALEKKVITSYPTIDVKSGILNEKLVTYTGFESSLPRFFPGWSLPQSNPIVRCAKDALSEVLGADPRLIHWKFSTDGAYTAGTRNIPTIGFGPSEEEQAHMPNEYVSLSKLVTAVKGYIVLALRLSCM